MGQVIGKILLSILAVILPPAVAVIKVGCSKHLLINIILTILGWLPGGIHALWLVWAGPSSPTTA